MNLQELISQLIKRCSDFQDFWENNQDIIIEYAEACTGEQVRGREPLLPMSEVYKMAKEWWSEEIEDREIEIQKKIQIGIGLMIATFAGVVLALVVISI